MKYIWIFFLVFSLFAAPVKVALIGDGNLVDPVTAELSSASDFELLERSGIEKVLNEHKLNTIRLSAGVLAKHFPHVDVFAVFTSNRLVVFNAKNGFRLWDDSPENATKKIVAAKNKLAVANPIYLSIVSVRDVGIPHRLNPKIEEFVTLFEQQLIKSPTIQMLERSHLGTVSDERKLTRKQFALTPSARLLTLEFEPGSEATIVNVKLIVHNLANQKLVSLEQSDAFDDLSKKTLSLGRKLVSGLLKADIPLSDRKKEAEQLFFYIPFVEYSRSNAAEIRLGIIPLDRNSEAIADLAGVLLSDAPGISLLERQQFYAVQKEFHIVGKDSLQFDKIQDVDIICVLRYDKHRELVIFDIRSGIRINDIALPEENVVVQAKIVATAIRHAAQKGELIGKNEQALKISMLPFLSINLPPELENTAQDAVTLLRRRFIADSKIFFLEREFMLQALKEPNRKNHELLKQLYSSAITVRPEGRNDDKGGGLLRIAFEKINGEIISETTISFSKGVSPQQILSQIGQPSSAVNISDKDAESKKLFHHAYFVFAHGGTINALELAAAGTALNPKQELKLAAMVFHACFNGGYRIPAKERGAFYIRNLSYAVPVAEKQDYFLFWAMRMLAEGHFSPQNFQQFSPEEQTRLKELIDRLIHIQHRICEKKIQNAPTLFSRIEATSEYLSNMDHILQNLWNMSIYNRYILPKLDIYIATTNKHAAQIEQFYAKNPNREFNLLQQSVIGKFHNTLSRRSPEDQAELKKVFDLLIQSEFLHIAWRGHYGYFALATNNKNVPPEAFFTARRSYNEALVKCFERCRFPNDRRNYLELQGYISTEYLLKIMDISIRRFGYYSAVRDLLVHQEIQTVSEETASRWHNKIYGFWKDFQNDPRSKNLSESDRVRHNSTLISTMRRLEEKFSIEPKITPEIICPSPWQEPVMPVEKYNLARGRSTTPCFDEKFIYFALLRHDSIQMYKLDTENDFSLTVGRELKHKHGWYGHMTGVLTDRYYIAGNGPYIYLFPRDGGAPEILDFSTYSNWLICATGYGEKLFLSYGQWAGLQKPGTVLEYDLKSRKTKVIISTLDKTVDWPMKKFQPRPYHVHHLLIDPGRKELLMLLHTNSFAYGLVAPPMKLWSYHYETEKWIERSGNLPVFNGASAKLYLENGQVILVADHHGAGPIGKDGVWRPWLMVKYPDARIVENLPEKIGNKDKKIDIDYSTPLRFGNVKFGETKVNLGSSGYSNGILFEKNALFFVREKMYYPFKCGRVYPASYLGSKYMVSYSSYSESMGILIFPLKDRNEILKSAERDSKK